MTGGFKAIFFLLMLACLNSASTLSLPIEVTHTCGTQVEFRGEITNALESPQAFRLSVIDPAGRFTYYATPRLELRAGETAGFIVLATPLLGTPSGEYNLFINAEGSLGETIEKAAWVTVNDCDSLALSVSGAQAACTGASIPLSVAVKNNGAGDAYGTVSLEMRSGQDGAASRAFETVFAGSNSFALQPGESKRFTVFAIVSLNESPGTRTINAYAFTAHGKTAVSTALEVRDCTQLVTPASMASAGQGQSPGGISGFFTAETGMSALGIILLILLAAFLFLRGGSAQEPQDDGALPPIPPAPRPKITEPKPLPPLPEAISAGPFNALGESDLNAFLERARQLEEKIRNAIKIAG